MCFVYDYLHMKCIAKPNFRLILGLVPISLTVYWNASRYGMYVSRICDHA
jgi:hypothetical protein